MLNFPNNLASSQGLPVKDKKQVEFMNYVPLNYEFKKKKQGNINLLKKLE